jgi:hypothetical protein
VVRRYQRSPTSLEDGSTLTKQGNLCSGASYPSSHCPPVDVNVYVGLSRSCQSPAVRYTSLDVCPCQHTQRSPIPLHVSVLLVPNARRNRPS